MPAQQVTHPSADALRAFALGKLSAPTAAAVMNHLDSCPDCCKQVAAVSGDDFVNRLRQARDQSSTSSPGNTVANVARAAKPSAGRTPVANLPPELAANQQYEILRELGRGGMGVVYLAKNKLMDRFEVLKVVNKTLLDHPGAVERFLREIRSAAKLSHANVVGAYHALQMGELLAFAMEYVEGHDLGSLVKSQGPLPIPHACFYVQQAAAGLQHAHEKQMVHRDIKPQNLILAREGKKHIVKVLDFGLAKVMREKSEDTGLTGEGKMLGTPDYIAPEQTLDAAKADIRADIYSLGCTLYYLLSGHPPFSATSLGAILLAHQMQEAKPLNLERPEVPEELAAVVRKMMAKTPAKRYQTPLDVVQALSPFVKQGTMPKASPELSVGATEAKPVVKVAAPVAPPPAPAAKEAKAPEPANVWGSLTEGSSASAGIRKSAIVRNPRAATVRERTSQKKWLLDGGIGVGVLLLALLGMWAGGVFEGKVQVKTKDGILIVEVNEPNPEVLVDGETVTVKWQNGGKKAEIHVKPGTHKVEVKKDGFTVDGTELTFKDGDKEVFTARLVPEKGEEKADAPPPEQTPPPSDTSKTDAPRVVGGADGDKGFVPLFNGKDLTGWKTHPKQPEDWRVVKGANGNVLTCSGVVAGYLYSERGDYKDFHLRVEARMNVDGGGGVYIRSPFGPQIPKDNSTYPIGYEALINSRNINGTGSLFNGGEGIISSHRQVPIPPDQWFWMEVIAEGNHITVKVNGTLTADYTDENRRFISGYIVLEQFRAGTRIEFRKIEIKELPAAATSAPPKQAAKEKDSFFNEKDLSGWDGLPGYWQAKFGCIFGEPPPGQKAHTFLCSKKHYRDFDLKFRVKREGGVGNSGVQFRSQINNMSRFTVIGPQCEIDDLNHHLPPGSLVTEPNGIPLKVKPSATALAALAKVYTNDGFNDFHIRCVGKHVTIKVNDVTTVDDVFPSLPEEGIIAWQLHGTRPQKSVMFRIVEFTDLSASASAEGFVPLFNGKDLTGWKTHPSQPGGWSVEDGCLVGRSATHHHLFSERGDYEDFHLKAEVSINKFGNSGIWFRSNSGLPRYGAFPAAYCAQILNSYPKPDVQLTGSLYGFYPIRKPIVKPDEWFPLEIVARGNQIIIKVNGKTTVDFLDKDHTYRKGHLVLKAMSDEVVKDTTIVRFRTIEIKELK